MEIMADAVDAREVPTHILTVALILNSNTILLNITTMIINATRSSLTPQDDENTPP